ncbi:hypothetical protein ISS05_04580 [Candidatus Woesearchaeota archaeon]|nr:hypothetical protein [Candidatus Woesearchaeota archaeon]
MGLETVKDEIIKVAKRKAEEVISEGKKEADKLLHQAEETINQRKEELNAELKKTETAIKNKETAFSELEIKKMFLEGKKKAIGGVFEGVRKKLNTLNSKKREAHIKKLLGEAQKELDVKHVYCNARDRGFVEGFDVEETEILGGIIAENEQKELRVDYSYELLLDNIREKHMNRIGNILFG